MPPADQTRALILMSVDSKEDKILTLFTERFGRIGAVARHARRSQKRFRGHIEPISLAEVAIHIDPNRSLARVYEAHALETFSAIKSDLRRVALASTMAEVVLQVVPEYDHEPALYVLLVRAWDYLNQPDNAPDEDHLLLFELRVLDHSGFLPELERIPGLPSSARETLEAWRAGRWQPMRSRGDRRATARILEGILAEQSGRGLRSRAFLDQALS